MPYVPQSMAFVFHSLSAIALLMQFLMTIGWVGCLVIAGAVSPAHFTKYMNQIDRAIVYFHKLTEIGTICFILNVGVLFSAMIWSTSTNTLVLNLVGLLLPPVVILPTAFTLYHMVSFMGRVAYHGLLMADSDPNQTSAGFLREEKEEKDDTYGDIARESEVELSTDFYQDETMDNDKVLDLYVLAKREAASNAANEHVDTSDGSQALFWTRISNAKVSRGITEHANPKSELLVITSTLAWRHFLANNTKKFLRHCLLRQALGGNELPRRSPCEKHRAADS